MWAPFYDEITLDTVENLEDIQYLEINTEADNG